MTGSARMIPRIVDEQDLRALEDHESQPSKWTAIIPAAGRGTRLGFDKPKLLYPVAGKTILEWLLAELEPLCEQFVFVVSPSGAPAISPELQRLLPGRCNVVVQREPIGMGHAVLTAREMACTPYSLVIWGDQVGARGDTMRACMIAHERRPNALATCATVLRDHPYIHFDRDSNGRLRSVLQQREGDELPDRGESDCGLFLFNTVALFKVLDIMCSRPDTWGRRTREFNLLPILPQLDQEPGNVCCVRIREVEQSMGINTATDAEAVSASLRARAFGDRRA